MSGKRLRAPVFPHELQGCQVIQVAVWPDVIVIMEPCGREPPQ